ncbi:MAG: patatin-like protein, partial [Frankia sp.]
MDPAPTGRQDDGRTRNPAQDPDRSTDRSTDPASTNADGMTQEVRFAVVMTGGASLAVWMGGVAREINLLTAPRPDPDPAREPAAAGSTASTATAGPPDPRRFYHRLVDLLQLDVSVDVLSGTSAGAINAAALGYANVSGGDLASLRDLWLTEGGIERLLRDPAAASFPSLLQGDAELLRAIREVLDAIDHAAPPPDERPNAPTSVFITTTFLHPEIDTFTDDVGTAVREADHHGLFSFGEADLAAEGARARLALAARASASFPGAFEPAFVPIGEDADHQHPDMAGYVNAARGHFVADGGLLDNRPFGPALEAIFDRPAARQVRRVLAYVVPTIELPRSAVDRKTENQPAPPRLARALMSDLDAALTQTISGELTRLRDHNTRTRTRRDGRRRLAALRVSAGEPLVDASSYAVYRARQATALCDPVVEALLRMVVDRAAGSLPAGAKEQAGALSRVGAGTAGLTIAGTDDVFAVAVDRAAAFLPHVQPGPDSQADLWRLGRPALDGAVTTLLDLIREGYVLATRPADRAKLAGFSRLLHDARPRAGAPAPRVVWTVVSEVFDAARDRPLRHVVAEATDRWLRLDYADDDRFREALTHGWSTVGLVARDLRDLLAMLIAERDQDPIPTARSPEPAPTASPTRTASAPRGAAGEDAALLSRASRPGGLSVRERRALAVDFLTTFVGFLPTDADECVLRLVDLHLAEVVLADGGAAAAPVELAQVSADTRTLLDPSRDRATQKLTGLQLAHFGALLKQSWRASDWMWGRLDGAGWLVHLLLDPRRLVTLRDMAGDADHRATWASRLRAGLTSIAGTGPTPEV